MQKQRLIPYAGGVLLALALIGAAAATGASPRPVYKPPQRYYLALGDSIAYGLQPGKGQSTGYAGVVAARLRAPVAVNYGCPGETTATFVKGGCPWLGEGKKTHDPFRGSQLDAAVAFLKAHRSEAGLVTLTLWGNDVFEAFAPCRATVTCIRNRGAKVTARIAANLGSILRRLHAAAPRATVVVTGAWNFDTDRLAELNPFFWSVDDAIRGAAAKEHARFADVRPLFNPPGIAAEKRRLCAYSYICSDDDVHPNDAGYRAIAGAVLSRAALR